jgi:hypothetical protein
MKRSIKMLGLTVMAALSVMAFSAVTAQGAELNVAGSLLAGTAELEGVTGKGNLLVSPLGLNIECTGGTAVSKDTSNSGGEAHGTATVKFTGCVVVKSEKTCLLYPSSEAREKKVETGTLLASGKLRAASTEYLLAEENGKPFSTVFMSKGLCTLPPENTVTGSAALKVDAGTTEAKSHTVLDVTSAEEATLKVALKYGNETAELDGNTGTVSLLGSLLNKEFSLK